MFGWFKTKHKEPERSWASVREQVGNCPHCGNPIFERFEERYWPTKLGLVTEQRRQRPYEIVRTCGCACSPSATTIGQGR